jgi:two-component system, sensor histidine kinase and response regulator
MSESSTEAASNSNRHAARKVLIVDDTEDVRSIIAESLSLYGLNALTAPDGRSGVAIAKREHPDLIICDINMPEMDGYSTLTALREEDSTAAIPFIFLSGAADKLNMRRGMELGADDYLTKPFTHAELMAAVNTRLDKQAELQRRSDKKLDELRGSISLALPHELRTPLNGIMGLASLMMDDYSLMPPEEVLESARFIHESALRLHRLIENFLVFSQIQLMANESKRIEIPPSITPVVIEKSIPEWVKTVAARHKREADLILDVQPAAVRIPSENLQKIVEELADNALKFSEPGKIVSVSASAANGAFSLTVADKGRGMTAEQISQIAPHIQFDRKTYEQQGAGLGLVIAKRLTELLGGQFVMTSKAGIETVVCVSFRLPAR